MPQSQARFVVQPFLTAIAMAYRNAKLIADQVLVRFPVGNETFKYNKYALADGFTVPNTLVGRKGAVNEIDWSAEQVTDMTDDHGLDDVIPYKDILLTQNAPQTPIDPMGRSVELISDLLALDREIRTAALVFDPDTYVSGQKDTLVDEEQWSFKGDDTNPPSDPITDITTAMDAMLMRPTTMAIGRKGFTALATNPRIVKAYNATAGDTGIVPVDFIRTLFGLDEILIGEGWVNTAKKGQAPTLSRVWGPHCALFHKNPLVTQPDQNGVTFGFTAQWGPRVAGTMDEPKIGLRGATRVRVGESVKELISSSICGYLFTDVAA
jgi:hypothetical protein